LCVTGNANLHMQSSYLSGRLRLERICALGKPPLKYLYANQAFEPFSYSPRLSAAEMTSTGSMPIDKRMVPS